MSRRAGLAGWLLAGLAALAPLHAGDLASLQRGERMYMHQCVGCHSLKYLRYSRIQQDLGLSATVLRQDLARLEAAADAPVISPMTAPVAGDAFGKRPPDLSLEVAVRGRRWVRDYLDGFYLDPASDRGWNNALLPHAAMPDPFWREQGIRGDDGHGRPGPWRVPGVLKPEVFQGRLDDLVGFLQYASAPDMIRRRALGPWVLGFLALFTGLAWALKRAWWTDIRDRDRAG